MFNKLFFLAGLLFSSFAWAGPEGGSPGLADFLPLIVIFVIFYFLLIRPQAKKTKEHKKMVDAVSADDEVVTNGGLYGRVKKVDEQFLHLLVADGVVVRVQRHAIASLVPKGTMDTDISA